MSGNKPQFNAYTIREYKVGSETKSAWTKIDVAFAHKNGGGFEINLDALPLNGRITLREPLKDDAEVAGSPEAWCLLFVAHRKARREGSPRFVTMEGNVFPPT